MDKIREWIEKELDHLETIRMDIDADTYVERKQLLRRFLEEINTVDNKEGIEDLNDIFKEPDDYENKWDELKNAIEFERDIIRTSDDDGLIRVGRFRTLNRICEIVKALEGNNG